MPISMLYGGCFAVGYLIRLRVDFGCACSNHYHKIVGSAACSLPQYCPNFNSLMVLLDQNYLFRLLQSLNVLPTQQNEVLLCCWLASKSTKSKQNRIEFNAQDKLQTEIRFIYGLNSVPCAANANKIRCIVVG